MEILQATHLGCAECVGDTPDFDLLVWRRRTALGRAGLCVAPSLHSFNDVALLFSMPALPGMVFHPVSNKSSFYKSLCPLQPAEVRRFGPEGFRPLKPAPGIVSHFLTLGKKVRHDPTVCPFFSKGVRV